MSLRVEVSGEDVANLSVTTGKNDTETGFHTYRIYQATLEPVFVLPYCRCSWELGELRI
jgi:hypothetical protein